MSNPDLTKPLNDHAQAGELLEHLDSNSEEALRIIWSLPLPELSGPFERLYLLLQQQSDIIQRLESHHWIPPFTRKPFRHLSPQNRVWVLQLMQTLLEREAAELDREMYL